MHTWLYTQTEGWWRMAFDKLHVPFDYISTQTVSREPDLRSKYDVIIFGPAGRVSTEQIVNGMPMWGNPLPWQTTTLTPNLGKLDANRRHAAWARFFRRRESQSFRRSRRSADYCAGHFPIRN